MITAKSVCEELKARSWSKAELARRTGLRYSQICEITLSYRPARKSEYLAIERVFELEKVSS